MKIPHFVSPRWLCLLPLIMTPCCRDQAAQMAKGFRLPDGNQEQGQKAFIELKCTQCHTVAGVELAKPAARSQIAYELGGVVRKVKSYGELVTSIIQPQHVIAPEYRAKLEADQNKGIVAVMPSYNNQMTVSQMIDIVTFLHAHYQQAPPPQVTYPYYAP